MNGFLSRVTGELNAQDVDFPLNEFVHNLFLNALFTGRIFFCYMLDESVCHFRGVRSVLLLSFYF